MNSTQSTTLRDALQKIADSIPACDNGMFFTEHFTPDGEPMGVEQHDPVAIIGYISQAARAALAAADAPDQGQDDWKQAVFDACAVAFIDCGETPNPWRAIEALIARHVDIALDPAVSERAAALAARPAPIGAAAPDWQEPTGEMWSAGRDAFLKYARQWSAATTSDLASVIADIAPGSIFNAMQSIGDAAPAAPIATPTDKMTEFKTNSVMKRGYQKVGYVLQMPGGDYCLSSQSAVRWLDQKQYWRLMHEQDGSLFAAPIAEVTGPKLSECRHCGFFVALNQAPAKHAKPEPVEQASDSLTISKAKLMQIARMIIAEELPDCDEDFMSARAHGVGSFHSEILSAGQQAVAVDGAPSTNSAAGRDVARYRWLRDKACDMGGVSAPMCAMLNEEGAFKDLIDGVELDDAIDAAIATMQQSTSDKEST